MLKMSKEAREMFPGGPFVVELSIISNIFSVLAILSTLSSVRGVKTVSIYLDNFSVPVLQPILNNLIGFPLLCVLCNVKKEHGQKEWL